MHPDSTTAVKIADAINKYYPSTSIATDSGVVNVEVPVHFRGQTTNFLAAIGNIDVKPGCSSKSYYKRKNGNYCGNGKCSDISGGGRSNSSNITIFLNPTTGVSQPLPFSQGATTILEEKMPN